MNNKSSAKHNNQLEQTDKTIQTKQKGIDKVILAAIITGVCTIIAAIIGWIAYDIIRRQHIQNEKENITFSFESWQPWGGITSVHQENTVSLDGEVGLAGYYSTIMDISLKGKVVVLTIENARASLFYNNCLIKITVNNDDRVIKPNGINTLIFDGYVPTGNNRLEFPLPPDFDGKLGFVFHNAVLNNLRITASYK